MTRVGVGNDAELQPFVFCRHNDEQKRLPEENQKSKQRTGGMNARVKREPDTAAVAALATSNQFGGIALRWFPPFT